MKTKTPPTSKQPHEETELLPCPFCGNTEILTDEFKRQVVCSKCGGILESGLSVLLAIERWNRRASLPKAPAATRQQKEILNHYHGLFEQIRSLVAPVTPTDASKKEILDKIAELVASPAASDVPYYDFARNVSTSASNIGERCAALIANAPYPECTMGDDRWRNIVAAVINQEVGALQADTKRFLDLLARQK